MTVTEDELVERYHAFLGSLGLDSDEVLLDEDVEDQAGARYVLVERNTQNAGLWVTTHDSPADAASYHDGQEYPNDYEILYLRDLVTGADYAAEKQTAFELSEVTCPACWPHDASDCTCGHCNKSGLAPLHAARVWVETHPEAGLRLLHDGLLVRERDIRRFTCILSLSPGDTETGEVLLPGLDLPSIGAKRAFRRISDGETIYLFDHELET